MNNEILKFILNTINKITNKKLKLIKNIIDEEYLHKGYLDSLQIIHFIIILEKKYKIKFTAKDKESMEFRTFRGLINIIKRKTR